MTKEDVFILNGREAMVMEIRTNEVVEPVNVGKQALF